MYPIPPRGSALWNKLGSRGQKGSKPRCHLLTHGDAGDVATLLSGLIQGHGIVRPGEDVWLPQGFGAITEADLCKVSSGGRLFRADTSRCDVLRDWWLAEKGSARTPNWDLASTCLVGDKPGFLLIEAKAHIAEMTGARSRKPLKQNASAGSRHNHARIDDCIKAANRGLVASTQLPWNLSIDTHYQVANRFTWSWKLTELGFPVILIYLGFLGASEIGRPLKDGPSWEKLVRDECRRHVPDDAWERTMQVHGQSLIPLIRSRCQALA